MPAKPYVIALEEHFQVPDLGAVYPPLDANRSPALSQRLEDVGALRIKEMDEAGIDLQVISHSAPSVQKVADADTAIRLARLANDRLAEAVRAHPDRFAGFATLPTQNADVAADELERAVKQLGFKGAMIHGLTNGHFHDEKQFWPIYARAEALDVPIYFHPALPSPAVVDAYYKEYAAQIPVLLRAAWGFTVETATQGLRMVLSGVFDKHPGLKVIMGHLGEGLPFYQWRIDHTLRRDWKASRTFREVFSQHFYVTTSGFWSNPALLCVMQEIGLDHIMFSVDYPFEPSQPATEWLQQVPLCAEDQAKLASGNARRLLKL